MTSIVKEKDHPAEIRRTLHLALPVIIGQLAVFSMNFVDTVMSGRLPNKEIALAALGIGGAFWSALLMFTLGILMAVQPNVAQLDGAGRYKDAGAYTRQAFWVAVALAVPYWAACYYAEPFLSWFRIHPDIVPVAAGYLKALSWGAPGICLIFLLRYFSEGTGHTKPTMVYGVLGALLNIPLNYVLMFGKLGFPALGTVGCGIASAIVIWISVLMLLAYLLWHRHFKPFALFSSFDAPDWRQIFEHLRVSLPIAVSIFVEGISPDCDQFLRPGIHDSCGSFERHINPGRKRHRARRSRSGSLCRHCRYHHRTGFSDCQCLDHVSVPRTDREHVH